MGLSPSNEAQEPKGCDKNNQRDGPMVVWDIDVFMSQTFYYMNLAPRSGLPDQATSPVNPSTVGSSQLTTWTIRLRIGFSLPDFLVSWACGGHLDTSAAQHKFRPPRRYRRSKTDVRPGTTSTPAPPRASMAIATFFLAGKAAGTWAWATWWKQRLSDMVL
jgi:hypothetical protein